MSTESFAAAIRVADDAAGKPLTNQWTYAVAISAARPKTVGETLPYHEHQSSNSAAPAPNKPDAWLQIWILGKGEWATWDGPAIMKPRTQPPVKVGNKGDIPNRLCAEFSGYIQKRTENGTPSFQFHALEPRWLLTQGNADVRSYILLRELGTVPILCSGKSPKFTMVAVLRSKPNDMDESILSKVNSLTITNIAYAIFSQVATGGLVVGFHLRNPTPKPSIPAADMDVEGDSPETKKEKEKRRKKILDELAALENDKAFPGFGKLTGPIVHSIRLTAGELDIGTTEFTDKGYGRRHGDERGEKNLGGWLDIVDTIQSIRTKVREYLMLPTEYAPAIRVKTLYTLTHGINSDLVKVRDPAGNVKYTYETHNPGMMLGSQNSWINTKKSDGAPNPTLTEFLTALQPHLATGAVWGQLSCCLGASPYADRTHGEFGSFVDYSSESKDKSRPTLTDPGLVGTGSFADTCLKQLGSLGAKDIAIWAHTSKGHALNNQELRVFTQHGNMDLCWLVEGRLPDMLSKPSVGTRWKDKSSWANLFHNSAPDGRTDGDDQPRCWLLFEIGIKHPGAQVKKILETWRAQQATPPSTSPTAPAAPPTESKTP